MTMRNLWVAMSVALCAGLVMLASFAAEPAKPTDPKAAAAPAGQPEFKLPPGWTKEDLEACMLAGTPGKNQEVLLQGVGVWTGKTTMFMGPDGPPMTSDSKSTVTKIMDGRFTKVDMEGDMPGMGPYHGVGIYGYDNVAGKFVSTWIDNHSTGIMTGTGELSPDGKTFTWRYSFNCPLTKKPAVMREVETTTGSNTKVLEMFGPDPKTGKEYKMMRVEMTRSAAKAPAATSAAPAK